MHFWTFLDLFWTRVQLTSPSPNLDSSPQVRASSLDALVWTVFSHCPSNSVLGYHILYFSLWFKFDLFNFFQNLVLKLCWKLCSMFWWILNQGKLYYWAFSDAGRVQKSFFFETLKFNLLLIERICLKTSFEIRLFYSMD